MLVFVGKESMKLLLLRRLVKKNGVPSFASYSIFRHIFAAFHIYFL